MSNPRFFIHPYFDVFVAEQVIELSIHSPFQTPTFDLSAATELTTPQSALVERHLKELGIVPRYSRFFRNEYKRLLRLAGGLRDSDLDVEKSLISFRDAAAAPTSNAWQHVFYAAVLSNLDLIEYLSNQELPPYR